MRNSVGNGVSWLEAGRTTEIELRHGIEIWRDWRLSHVVRRWKHFRKSQTRESQWGSPAEARESHNDVRTAETAGKLDWRWEVRNHYYY